jgi:hypothetical protein
MPRLAVLIAVALLTLLGVTAQGRLADAQEAGTPPAGPMEFEIAPGVTAIALAFIPGQESPAVYQLRLDPGVTYAFQGVPDLELAYIESGTLTLTLDKLVTVTRSEAADQPGEAVEAGTEFSVSAGDYFVLPLMGGGELRNDGSEPALMTVASIVPSQPMATPTP